MSSIDLPPLQEPYIRRWIRGHFTKSLPPSKGLDLSGQTGILVGGTDGIGLACARVLLKYKLSMLILGARNLEKGEAIAKTLLEKSPSADVRIWELEMLSYQSIQDFAKKCEALERIDFVIIGAGVLLSEFRINPSTGHELTVQVLYWSTALLSLLLLPILKQKHAQGKPAHLTIISSDLAHIADFKERNSNPLLLAFDKPIPWTPSSAVERYNSCKVLLMMLVLSLKDVADPTDVIVNCLCPGMSKPTSNEREQPWLPRTFSWLMRILLGRSLETCALVCMNAAVEQGVESHGSFLASWQISPFVKLMYTEEGRAIADRLWKETLQAFQFAGLPNLIKSI